VIRLADQACSQEKLCAAGERKFLTAASAAAFFNALQSAKEPSETRDIPARRCRRLSSGSDNLQGASPKRLIVGNQRTDVNATGHEKGRCCELIKSSLIM
jgi:hypothetical protein